MCGIAGFTHLNGFSDPERIWHITRSLTHRGPDQQDVWESPDVSLGAVRLKIIDLENGAQPMVSDDGRAVLVFNGEIYNHGDLRRELIQLGHRFRTQCDTETLLHAFLEWDVEAFKRLRGMFGAAFWNQSERRLVLVRDRLGIKPVYFARQHDDIYFGSELKAILLHPGFDRRLSGAGLHHYLSLNYVPGPSTLVEGIEKLQPGHWLEWRDGRISKQAYWRLDFQPDRRRKRAEAKEELDVLLREAVREQLVADVPVGVWSSGGLDSSTIVHYASEFTRNLKTFSVSFNGRRFDESPYFREIARQYQTDHHEFDLNPDSGLADAVLEMAHYSDEPSADAGALPVWFLSKISRDFVTVTLSGEGADEVFGGYITYLADRYARRLRAVPAPLRRWLGDVARLLPVTDEKIGLDYKISRLLAGSQLPPLDAHLYWNGTFSRSEKRGLLNAAGIHLLNGFAPLELPGKDVGYLNRFLWLDQLYYLPDDILYKSDRMSMAHSLEVRPPFLDHRIVEFAARLPENLKIRGGTLKFLLRDLMKDRLPRPVVKRRKEGFDIPAHHWLRTVLRPLLLDTLDERAVKESGIFSWPAIETVLRDHLDRRANLGYHLWGLLVLFQWMRYWGITAPPKIYREAEPVTVSASSS
ncbi:MAG: asparagine synthase (glutamine-hydrolyzing) [Bryobacterales bacterium]|nr:asparagine synthase (glutamine-hydrolyzing) [Bryobacterales bacterium]